MERRELRPKRELLALLTRLNDCVGVSARRVFTQQVTTAELLQLPPGETRRRLPELFALVETLLPNNNNIASASSETSPPSEVVRRAFRHRDAQWLSRSARQSGISALLCQQLVRLARQQSTNDDDNNGDAIYWSAAELTMQILLDALLAPCAQRLGQAPDACKWRPTQPKPRFHAMTCFPVWSSLLPFAALMGLRFPEVFLQVLEERRQSQKKGNRANCDFAHVTGVWRLVEELNRGDKENREAVTRVMTSLLRLASDKLLFCAEKAKGEKKLVDAHLDDQLLEKFFTGLQAFSFNSGRASAVLKPAVFSALQNALAAPAARGKPLVVPQRVVVFTAVACMFVKDVASGIVSMVLKRVKDASAASVKTPDTLLAFLVGFCAHEELVPLKSVIEVLGLLVVLYKAVPQQTGDQDAGRRQLLFYVVYVALHRCKNVDSLRQEVGSDAAVVMERLAQIQMQLCGEIAFEDFYAAAPVHWAAQVWKHWVFLSDEQVQSFVSEAHENDAVTEEEFKARGAVWRGWEAAIAFRPVTFSRYPQMKTLLKPHLVASIPLEDMAEDDASDIHARKRRRTAELSTKTVDPEQLERSFDVLLLPDVMERVCSFMSAKRLCRMALVCRTFAEVSHRPSLWRGLYVRGSLPAGKKLGAVPPSLVACRHGDSYEHNWRQLYQQRWKVLRKLRRLQRRAVEAGPSGDREPANDDDVSGFSTSSTFIPQICSVCGCDQVFKTAGDQVAHDALHQQFTCPESSCRATFTGAYKFKQHMREHGGGGAPASTPSSDAAPGRLECGFPGCNKSYVSAKRLATHRQKEGHRVK
jgi:hypothetical protein